MLIINIHVISDNNIVTINLKRKYDCDNKLHCKLLKVPKSHVTYDKNEVLLSFS